MNQEKLNKYNLTASFHTMTVKSAGLIDAKNYQLKDVFTANVNQERDCTTTTINLNKINGDIFDFEEFKRTFKLFRKSIDMTNYRFLRADFRLDNYDTEHYKEFAKLNKLLISAMAITYNVKNCYKTDGLFSQEQLSVAIKNDYFQLENYDREAKNRNTENHNEPAKARLEERTMAREFFKESTAAKFVDNMEILKEEFKNNWLKRWDKALTNLDAVGDRYNDELERIYNKDKDAFPVRFRTLTDFLIMYQDCIFSQKQLINLLERLGIDNAKDKAKYHKKRYGLEYFSKSDVKKAVEEIKRATMEYFGENQKGGTVTPIRILPVPDFN